MSGDEVIPVVIDNGSDTCKVGMAGDNEPKSVFPCVVGQHQNPGSVVGLDKTKGKYIGQEAVNKEDILTLTYPVQRGLVTDWDAMEAIWQHVYQTTLSVPSSEHPILVTETPNNPKTNREKMAEIFFEKFKVPAFFVSCQAVLTLYSAGRTTGAVLDIGSGVTTAVPVYEGYRMSEAVSRMDFAGGDITDFLMKLLSERGYQFPTPADKANVRAIKEKLCYVANTNLSKTSKEHSSSSSSSSSSPSRTVTTSSASYSLPDGKVVTLDAERHQVTETLFQPSVYGRPGDPSVQQMVRDAIAACEIDTRKSLYNNVILSGGSTLFDGMADRLRAELKSFGGLSAEARISAPKDRLLSAWAGGSVLASLSTFETMWIGRNDYEDSGSKVVHTRCF